MNVQGNESQIIPRKANEPLLESQNTGLVFPQSLCQPVSKNKREIYSLMQRRYQSKGNRKIEAETVAGATQLEIMMSVVYP